MNYANLCKFVLCFARESLKVDTGMCIESLNGTENQFSSTRVELSSGGAQESNVLSVSVPRHSLIVSAATAALLLLVSITAVAVPISDPVGTAFYSIQLRGLSYDLTGETVGVHVYDMTYDTEAYGHVTITDLTTSTVLLDFTSGNYGNYDEPGTFDTATFLLPYGDLLRYDINGQEFSFMSIFLGDSYVAGGAAVQGVFPTFSMTEMITPVPEPLPLALLGLGLVGLVLIRRKKA